MDQVMGLPDPYPFVGALPDPIRTQSVPVSTDTDIRLYRILFVAKRVSITLYYI
jgi:hypothetical protein